MFLVTRGMFCAYSHVVDNMAYFAGKPKLQTWTGKSNLVSVSLIYP